MTIKCKMNYICILLILHRYSVHLQSIMKQLVLVHHLIKNEKRYRNK